MNFFKNCKTIAEAKTLFRTLAHQLHPDKSGGDTEEAFKALLNEFENLSFTKEQDKYYEHAGNNKDFADIINELMTNPNYAGIEFEVIGSWIWLSGDTKPVKDHIKGLIEDKDENSYVCRWMNKKARWVFRPKGYRKFTNKEFSIDEIGICTDLKSINIVLMPLVLSNRQLKNTSFLNLKQKQCT